MALAGVDAVLNLASTKLANGCREQALHLLDMVIAVDDANEKATILAIKAHEELLGKADNFWLNGWLENQIKLLKGGLSKPLAFD